MFWLSFCCQSGLVSQQSSNLFKRSDRKGCAKHVSDQAWGGAHIEAERAGIQRLCFRCQTPDTCWGSREKLLWECCVNVSTKPYHVTWLCNKQQKGLVNGSPSKAFKVSLFGFFNIFFSLLSYLWVLAAPGRQRDRLHLSEFKVHSACL